MRQSKQKINGMGRICYNKKIGGGRIIDTGHWEKGLKL